MTKLGWLIGVAGVAAVPLSPAVGAVLLGLGALVLALSVAVWALR